MFATESNLFGAINLPCEIWERRLGNQLDGGDCVVLSSDMRVKVPATTLYTYPDIVVICGKPEFEDDVFDTLLNPVVIIEVLSESTEKYDRGVKFKNYRELPSVQQVVLVSQQEPSVDGFVRQPDNTWLLTSAQGLESTIAFPMLKASVPLAEVYAGITFSGATLR